MQNHRLPPPSFLSTWQLSPTSLLATMSFTFRGQPFHVVAKANDGPITLSPRIVAVSPVIRAQAIAKAKREHARSTGEVSINIPVTVQDLRTLEQYVLRATQNVYPQPGEMNLPTLITIAECAVELEIPGAADLVASDISQTLVLGINDGDDVRDYPWLDLCNLAKRTTGKRFHDSISRCFFHRIQATYSPKDALWAFQIGKTAYEETGYPRLLTYSLYMCVAWGAFSRPDAPELPRAMASAVLSYQTRLVILMDGLATPRLCEVHHPLVCVGGDARRRCVDLWKTVWQRAHQVAHERLCDEYKQTKFGGAERDVLRMLFLIYLALHQITRTEPAGLASPMCDLQRLRASNGWLIEEQDTVRTIIDCLASRGE